MKAYFQPAREYSGGIVVEVAPSDITIKTTAGVAVESALAYTIDGDGHWYVTTTNPFYTSGQKYLLWTTTTTTLGVVTEDHPFEHNTPTTADTTGPGAATIRNVPSLATADSLTVTLTPPADADYDHTIIRGFPYDGGAAVSATGTAAGNVTIPGLHAGRAYLLLAIPYDATGNPGTIGATSWAIGSTLTEAQPANWASIKFYANNEGDVHEFGPYYFDPDAEAGKNFPVLRLGRFHVGRIRIECPCPVANFRVDSLGLFIGTAGPVTGEPSSDKGG